MDAITAGLFGGSMVAFIQGSFNYFDKRKTALEDDKRAEITNELQQMDKLLDFWMKKFNDLEQKQRSDLEELRHGFDNEKGKIETKYQDDLKQIRQDNLSEKTTAEMVIASLQTEIRQIIKQRGEDQLSFERQISKIKEDFNNKLLEIEKQKVEFLTGMLDRFENFCKSIGGNYESKNRNNTGNNNAVDTRQ